MDYLGGQFNWLLIILIIIIIIVIIYFIYLATTHPHSPNLLSEDEQNQVDRAENTFLAWVAVVAIFIAAGIIIRNFGQYGYYYSITFYIISIVLLIVINSQYLTDRKRLEESNITVPSRLDYLSLAIVILIILVLVIVYDMIKHRDLFDHHK